MRESTGQQLQRIQLVALYNQIALAGQKVGRVLEEILGGTDPLGVAQLQPGIELDYMVTVEPFTGAGTSGQAAEPVLTKEMFTSAPRNLSP